MSIRQVAKIKEDIEGTLDDVLCYLEESRYEPSERGAGTAPTQSAIDNFSKSVTDLVYRILDSGVDKEVLKSPITFEKIIAEINSEIDKDISGEMPDLIEVDSFIRDNGESKYRYVNTVYQHLPTKRYICVETQQGVGQWEGLISSVNAQETVKKEITKYEWT